MTYRFPLLAALGLLAAFVVAPTHGGGVETRLQAQTPELHDHTTAAPGTKATDPKTMMADMMAADAKLQDLVNKMNDLPGTAKTDAISEVVTALVQQHRAMHEMMMTNMPMMQHAPATAPDAPKK